MKSDAMAKCADKKVLRPGIGLTKSHGNVRDVSENHVRENDVQNSLISTFTKT